MKTKAICSFFVLFAIVSGIATTAPDAFADHAEVTIVPDTGSGSGNDDCIDVKYGCYIPGITTVDVGGKVIFSNTDSAAHTFTAGNPRDGPTKVFGMDLLPSGNSFEWTPDTIGEYPYFCMIHPWMDGIIMVEESMEEKVTEEEKIMQEKVTEEEKIMQEKAMEEKIMQEKAMEEKIMQEKAMEEKIMQEKAMEEKIMQEKAMEEKQMVEKVTEEGGGCLIATATYGSELAPQVQQLRELRDNTILQTESGTTFMTGFNQFYYSFSPVVADLERQSPIFKEIVKLTLTPMLSSLSLLNYVDIDSEQEMLGYGISLIILNAGMYVGIPLLGILKLYQIRK